MKNLLSQALDWTPEAAWNGAAFSLSTFGPSLAYTGTVEAGDVVAFGITVVSAPAGDPDLVIEVDGQPFATIEGSSGLPETFESTGIASGATVEISAQANASALDEAHYVYYIGDAIADASRVGYAKVSRDTGQHQVVASRAYAGYKGLHSGGVATNGANTIFVAGAADYQTLEALTISAADLVVAAAWSGEIDPLADSANYPISGIASDENTVFVLHNAYAPGQENERETRLYALEFDGSSFDEVASESMFPGAAFVDGSQVVHLGDYVVVYCASAPSGSDQVRVYRFDGAFTLTDSVGFFETAFTEDPFISTDGASVYFAGRRLEADQESIYGYSIDSGGQLSLDSTWEIGGSMSGARVGEAVAVARSVGSGAAMALQAHARTGGSLNPGAFLERDVEAFQPWGLNASAGVLIAPAGTEWLNIAINDDYWWDSDFPYRDPLRNSGIFDLSKSLAFTQWGESSTPVSIPDDNGATYAESVIVVSGQEGTTCRAGVQLEATHPFFGDLRAELVAPDGQVAYAMFANGSATPLYETHYVTYPNPTSINGEWKLRVYDMFSSSPGTLDSWRVGFVPAVLVGILNPPVDGVDAFSRLEAGFVTATLSLQEPEASVLLTPLAIEVPVPCEEIGPVSKANASAFNRTRVHSVRVLPGEKRCMVANFGGAVPASRTIASAVWQMESNAVASMANGQLLSPYRETEVTVTAHWPGVAPIECRATFDNGEVYVQRFMVEVLHGGWYFDTPAPSGALQISLSAP